MNALNRSEIPADQDGTRLSLRGARVPVVRDGDYVRVDVRRLQRMAIPRWLSHQDRGPGTAEGVPMDALHELLEEMAQEADSKSTDPYNQVAWSLGMLQRALRLHEEHLAQARIVMNALSAHFGEIADEGIREDISRLRDCLEPINRLWGGR